jgi:hypothetical protein
MKLEVTIVSKENWGTAGNGIMTIKNLDSIKLENWSFDIITEDFTINKIWNFTFDATTSNISSKSWNSTINPGSSINSDFSYSGSAQFKASSSNPNVNVIVGFQEPVVEEPIVEEETNETVPDLTEPNVNGIIWENKWDGPYRQIVGVRNTDPQDPLTNFRGSGYFEVENGIMTLSGGQPRFYIDVSVSSAEASFEYMKIGSDGYNWSGCVCGIRSNSEGHVDGGDAHTYYFRLRHDNKVDFYRELTHGVTGVILNSKPYELKSDVWYKYKFQCYNENGINKLKGYINDELILEAEDDNQHMYNSIGKVFIRNTNVNASKYKNFVIKEINGAQPIQEPVIDEPKVIK